MSGKSGPSILVLFPSSYYYPGGLPRDEIKSSPLTLASYLSQFFPVEYADFEFSIGRPETNIQIRRFERKAREFFAARTFDILALSCWTTVGYQATMAAAKIAREVHPGALIVVGGYHPTARPDDFRGPDSPVDYVIRGEGELALREIAEGLASVGRPSQTREVIGAPLTADDLAVIDWDLIDELIQTTFPDGLSMLTTYLSRGCPFECTFCVESLKNRTWRALPTAQAIEQARQAMRRFSIHGLGFGDACFGLQKSWRKEMIQLLAAERPECWILFETRPEFLDEDDIKLLSQMKVEIQFGVESCSPDMLRIMNKTTQPEKFLAKFRETSHRLSEYGIVHGANLIFNHPGETEKSLKETFAFMDAEAARGPSSLIWTCHSYMHFPGSAVDRHQAEYERRYGAVFHQPEWWKQEGNPFTAARKVTPSHDLSGSRAGMWQTLFDAREEAIKDALTPTAFKIAADALYPDWRNDLRYPPA
ncbi:MAG: B12-binding domain-containing radical SAM protein [candidate division Zixibacteria bacterium]|nr:B12-binding domain-containing radical SAM protein [candidate division Zixibacteria bacterium]